MTELSNQDLTFELAMGRLEETVRKLESGELSLSDAIERYKEAMQLVQFCRTQLDKAELEIEQLVDAKGQLETAPSATRDGTLEPEAAPLRKDEFE